MISKANYTSLSITTATTFPIDTQRNYFFITAKSGTATVEFNDGGGLLPIVEGGFFEPNVVPTSTITVTPSALGETIVCISGV